MKGTTNQQGNPNGHILRLKEGTGGAAALGFTWDVYLFGAESGAQWAGPPFVLYPEACEGEFEVAVCMPVAPGARAGDAVTVEEVPGGVAASTVHVGPYHEIGPAYAALQRWMADNGRRPAGGMREVYLNDPDSVPPEALLTEIDWPVE